MTGEIESRHRCWIIFFVLCCASHTCFLASSVFTASQLLSEPFLGVSHNGYRSFFHLKFFVARRVSTSLGHGSNSFPVFYPAFPQRIFRLSFFQSIRTRQRLVTETFLFLTYLSATIPAKIWQPLSRYLLIRYSLIAFLFLSLCLP